MAKVSTTILAFLLVPAFLGHAQTISGSISGRVVDQQGAVVPDAAVTASESAKNVIVRTKTNELGDFVLPGLQPGIYTVFIEAPGFKKLDRPNIALDANDKLALGNLSMQVGAVSEAVEVTGQAALLQTESVERSATLEARQIENIEVNGRNPLDLAKLIPGVVDTANFSVGGVGGLNGPRISSPLMASATSTPARMAART